MFYYAYLNEDNICVQIYTMPTAISGDGLVAIASNDQTLVGQRYNAETEEFEPMYYYAVLNEKNVVSETVFYDTQQTTTDTLLSITFAQYQTVTGLYWNGTEFVEPPISIAAKASTDEVNYKTEDKWLSTKLDEMDAATAAVVTDLATVAQNLTTVTTSLATVTENLAALTTVVDGKANAVHTHTAADLTGVVKTVNGNAPDENGNIVVTSGGMTNAEVLAAVKEVDGSGSGLDADTLDGCDASYFASVTALNGKADANHTHEGYATTEALTSALSGKADTTHNHDTAYAAVDHTHTGYVTSETLNTALSGKADSTHTHDGYATEASVTALENALNGKSDVSHTHSDYIDAYTYAAGMNNKADVDHSHTGYAPSSHTHSEYLSASGGTVGGNLNVAGILRVNGQQSVYDSGSMVTLSTNNRQTMIAGSAIFSKVAISVSSDERLKENIVPVDVQACVDFVDAINVKGYNYKGNSEQCVGVIAQDVIKTSPELAKSLVRKDENGYYSVKAADLVFPLIVAVQELTKKVSK